MPADATPLRPARFINDAVAGSTAGHQDVTNDTDGLTWIIQGIDVAVQTSVGANSGTVTVRINSGGTFFLENLVTTDGVMYFSWRGAVPLYFEETLNIIWGWTVTADAGFLAWGSITDTPALGGDTR